MAYTNRPAATWLASTLSEQSSNRWSLADLQRALALLDVGEADVLIVAKLDPLSRSLLDFAGLMVRPSVAAGASSPSTSAWTPPPSTASL